MSGMNETLVIDWEGRYRDGATGWERHGLNPAFLEWRDAGVLAPCRILFPGGGRSLEPLALAEAGFDVTVVDAAPSAVAMQRAHFERLKVNARAEQANLFEWEPDTPFDAIYDQTCLCALPPDLWPAYARRLHRWLRPDGSLFILFMQSDRPRWAAVPLRYRRNAPACSLRRHGVGAEPLPERVEHPSGLAEQPALLRRL